MGTIVTVASVAYNMAGDEAKRPQYLKSLVVQNIISGTRASMAESLNSGYLHGPAIKLLSFYRWAANPAHYGTVGLPSGKLSGVASLDATLVEPHVPHGSNEEVEVQTADHGDADPTYWARRWILDNRPADIDAAWTVDYDKANTRFVIRFPNNTTQNISASGYDNQAKYIYVQYALVDLTTDEIGGLKVWIYKVGSGNTALDRLIGADVNYGQFFPFIPFRLETKFLSETNKASTFRQVKKAYKKATGAKLADLIEELKENKNLGDIDHGYVVFGVSLNVLEKSCRRYLYRFFEKLQQSQWRGVNAYADYEAGYNANAAAISTWLSWQARRSKPFRSRRDDAGDPMPPYPSVPSFQVNQIRIVNTGSLDTKYDIRLRWATIRDGSGTGKGRSGAKRGDCWLSYIGEDTVTKAYVKLNAGYFGMFESSFGGGDYRFQKFRIYWQRTDNSFTWLEVHGLVHQNFIYGDNAVVTGAKKALQDPEESGLIIPLHYQTWRETSLVDSSQMGTACMFAVFNCYEVYKQKWYETGIFQIFLVIVIAIVSVLFTGGAGFGLLGSHMALGVSMGLTGLTAAVAGSVLNALAAMLLMTVIQQVATAAFGPLGNMIAAIIGMLTMNVVSAFQNGGLTLNWGQLLKVDNLLALTDAVGQGIAGMLQQDTLNMQDQWNDFYKQSQDELRKIQEVYQNQFGYGGGYIDPLMFTSSPHQMLAESSDTFLTRTLMTGSEIAELSRELLYNFPEHSLKLPNAFT